MNNKDTASRTSRDKTISIIISLALALGLWGYVIARVNPLDSTEIIGIPVQVLNAESLSDRALALVSGGNATVNVVVEGKRTELGKISASDIVATVDLAGYGVGTSSIMVNVAVPTNVALKSATPGTVDVIIEELVSVEKPVEIVYSGTIPAGYEVGFLKLEPAAIPVSGPSSLVNQVSSLRLNLDLAQITEEGHSFEATVSPVNSGLTPVEGVKLSTSEVTGSVFLCETKEVELHLNLEGKVAEGYGLLIDAPETIRVRSASVDLSTLDSVTTEAINIKDLTQSQTVPLALLLPEGVEVADGYEELEAYLDVQKSVGTTVTIPASDVLFRNLKTGKQAQAAFDVITVTVSGPESVVQSLDAGDFSATIDLQHTEKNGQATWPLQVEYTGKDRLHRFTYQPNVVFVLVTEMTEPEQ